MKNILLSICLFFSFLIGSNAQCSFFVTAEADQEKVCSPGATVTLTGDTDASNIIDQFWEPTSAVSNSTAQVTTANVTATTLFTYSVTAQSTDNLIAVSYTHLTLPTKAYV